MILPVLLILGACIAPPTCAQGLPNLLQNPSFEAPTTSDAGQPEAWVPARASTTRLSSPGHTGAMALCLSVPAGEAAPARVTQGPLPARPEATYQFSCWVRSGAPFRVLAREDRGPGLPPLTTELLRGLATPDWTSLEGSWFSSDAARAVTITLVADSDAPVWFDDLALVHVADRPRMTAPFLPSTGSEGRDWTGAAQTTAPFLALDGDGTSAPLATAVRAMHDGAYLHLAFECAEPSPQALIGAATTPGPQVWSDDCVEVFIAPEYPSAGVIHLGISAGGGRWQERAGGRQWYSDGYSWAAGPAAIPPWSATVTIGSDGWQAAAAIPLSALGGRGVAGRSFGLQLCRTRRAGGAPQYSTWAFTPGPRYLRPEAFGTLTLAPTALPGRPERLSAAAAAGRPSLLPAPRRAQWTPGRFQLQPSSTIRITAADQTDAALWLQEDLRRRFGLALPISLDPPADGATADVLLGLAPSPDALLPPEGFSLTVGAGGVRLVAGDPRGRQWGVAALRQLLSSSTTGPSLPFVLLADAPALRLRGWHFTSPLQSELPLYHRLLDTMALLRLNTLVLQVDDRLMYTRHPEISRPGAATAEQLRELVDYARRRQIEVIPQLSTFSHFSYVLRTPQHAHLAESAHTTLGTHDRWNYCPLNPGTYPLVFDLMQEIIEAFAPRRFHIGHDEVSADDMAVCPRCRGREPADLWAADIAILTSWLRDRGLQPAMWADSLLADHTGGKPHRTYLALDRLPRDIILFDWRYEPDAPFTQTLRHLRSAGLEVVGCPWYEPLNIIRCASAAQANGALGACGTTWLELSPALGRWPHIPSALALAAEVFWSPAPPGQLPLQSPPGPDFQRIWRIAGGETTTTGLLALDLSPHASQPLADDDHRCGWMGEGPEYDLRSLPPGVRLAGEVPFRIPSDADNPVGARCLMLAGTPAETRDLPRRALSIPVGLRTAALHFLHCTGLPDRRDRRLYAEGNVEVVGYYVVHYEDGAVEVVPLLYQTNIDDWNSQRGPAQAEGILNTQTQAGALVTVTAFRWPNPRPEMTITSLDFVSSLAGPRLALLGLSAEVGGEPAAPAH